MKRRLFLSGLAAAAGGCGWVGYVEPQLFEVTHTRIRLSGLRPRRILHVSDIHMSDGMTAPELERGFAAGLSQRPDLICFTGDFVSATRGFDHAGLRRILLGAADTARSFAVLGNHDGGLWLNRHGDNSSTEFLSDLIRSTGVRLLHNESVEDDDLTLIGVGDLWSGEFEPSLAFAGANGGKAKIVLCHNPDGKDALRGFKWDLMLSGHTHGGQARIPGIHPTWTPVKDKRFVSGLYDWEGRQLFISRGLGSPKHVRAFCRPEVSMLYLG